MFVPPLGAPGAETQARVARFLEDVIKQMDKRSAELQKSLQDSNSNFNRRWGGLLEDLAEGDLLNHLKKVGLKDINRLTQNYVHRDEVGRAISEFDFLAMNTTDAVLSEVKNTLTKSDVVKLVKKTKKHGADVCKGFRRVYAAVIFSRAQAGAVEYALEQGLIVIKSPGGANQISSLQTPKNFTPKILAHPDPKYYAHTM